MNGEDINAQINEVLWECIWSKLSEKIYDTTSEKLGIDMCSIADKLAPDSFQIGYLLQEEIENHSVLPV